MLVTVAGIGGFVALLVLGHAHPGAATPLRWLALAWFFVFGAIKMTLYLFGPQQLARRPRRPRSR